MKNGTPIQHQQVKNFLIHFFKTIISILTFITLKDYNNNNKYINGFTFVFLAGL